MSKFFEFEDKQSLWDHAIEFIGRSKKVGVSGGSAGDVVEYAKNKEWFLVDERIVDYESKYCNCRILREKTSNQIHCLYHDDQFLEILPKHLECSVMGIGSDGHLASLFDGADFESLEVIISTIAPDKDTKDRLTLSMNYLLKSKKVLFLLFGYKKREIWNKIKNNQVDGLPIGYFLDKYSGELQVLFLDDYSNKSSDSSKP